MISCTEFIPLYSEFFKFLEKKGGHDAVMEYWIHISDTSIGDKTNPNSLAYKCDKLGGFEGAIAYWGHTLTEEACDLFEIEHKTQRYKYKMMRRCPSKGMLNDLSHVEPYYDYCSHCNVLYSRVLEKYDVVYERDNSKVDQAQCSSILYEKGNEPPFDFRKLTDEQIEELKKDPDVKIIDMKSEDNKYLHRDFHLLGDNALKYCADKYGYEVLLDFLNDFVKNYYSPQIEKIKKNGLIALKEWIEKVYEIEEASELIKCEIAENALTVTIEKSPVIEYMHSLGQKPSEYYIEETRTLYKSIADACGFEFNLEYYKEDGATRFTFSCN